MPPLQVCLLPVCLHFKNLIFISAKNVSGTRQSVFHSRLPDCVLRGTRKKDTDAASFDMKTAITNKQLVITKNIFFDFTVSKLVFLYKAATASGAVLGRSKKN